MPCKTLENKGGNGAENSMYSFVFGWIKPSRAACNSCPVRAYFFAHLSFFAPYTGFCHHRSADARQMNTNLVGAARFRPTTQQCAALILP